MRHSPLPPTPRNDLEIELVRQFVLPDRQERLLFLQARRRQEFVTAFHTEKFLNLQVATAVALTTDIFALMKRLGASEECYAISAQSALDARTMSLREALEQCVGSSIETVLLSPGTRIGYYEGGGYTGRYVLSAKPAA